MSSILSFVALKLSDVKRYSDDDRWCMDRGLGLFADLNVLPKSAWLSSYSSGVTKEMNMGFLKSLHEIWLSHGLLSDTCNLDFTTIPYWGRTIIWKTTGVGKETRPWPVCWLCWHRIPTAVSLDYGKTKPALIITNDFDISTDKVVRKYCRRWIVEKGICEQIEFFHLNRLSSSMVIKVDFDLTMTLLAHNLYRLFALDLERYSERSDERIYEKFVDNNGTIEIEGDQIKIELKKRRDLPQIIEMMKKYAGLSYQWLANKKLVFYPSSTS